MSADSGGMGAASSSQVQVDVGDINANTNDLETLQGLTNTKLDDVNTELDNIEATLTTIESQTADAATAANQAAMQAVDGALADAASATGSRQAQLRSIAESCDANESSLNAIETSVADVAKESKQDTQIKRSFGGVAGTDVHVVNSTGAKTFTFHGIQVIDAITLTTVTDTNLGGDSLAGVTLNPGYHPIAGTAINCSSVGLAYLIGA